MIDCNTLYSKEIYTKMDTNANLMYDRNSIKTTEIILNATI